MTPTTDEVTERLATVLKAYVCHKIVTAAEITSVGNYLTNKSGALVRSITLAGQITIELPETMFARYLPVAGDFLVVYEDGYKSFSPRKAFEEGYKATGESFADIKKGIQRGKADPDQT